MAKKSNFKKRASNKPSKAKSQRRVQDAFQIAQKEERYSNRAAGGSDSEDSDNEAHTKGFKGAVLNARKHLGEEFQNKGDDSDDDFDDEELDSDDALGSDDEYDVLNSKFSQTIRDSKKQNSDYTDNEDDGYNGIDENELIPLSEVWAMDDEDIRKAQKEGLKSSDNDLVFNDEDPSESKSESELSSSDDEGPDDEVFQEEDPFDEISDDEDVLTNVITGLKSKAKKETRPRKTLVNDKTDENQFGLPTQGKKLSLADMMMDEADSEEAMLLDKPASLSIKTAATPGEIKSKALSVPLPQSIQKKIERKAAYDIQKEEVEKWTETIQANRRADVLKFENASAASGLMHNKSSSFKPTAEQPITALDSKLDQLLEQSNLESKTTEDLFDQIETAKVSKAEMMKRTNELRLMRELMYRGQKDSKRLKKIKSKVYRQKLRKERMRNQELMQDNSDLEDDENNDEEDADYKRARERMSLKHKNTSQWAKSMIKSGMMKDKENRDEMEEMLRQGEKLRMKQLGRGENEDSDEYDVRNLSDFENQEHNEVDDDTRLKAGKGVMAMDFMKNAEERERLLNKQNIEELKMMRDGSYDKREFADDDASKNNANVNINAGRRIYTPSAAVAAELAKVNNKRVLDEVDEDEASSLSNRLSKNKKKDQKKSKYEDDTIQPKQKKANDEESNPWLQDDDEDGSSGRKSRKVKVVDETSSKFDKSAAKMSKRSELINEKKRSSAKGKLDSEVQIDVQQTLKLVDPIKETKKKSKKSSKDSDSEYEGEAESASDINMFTQKDLIKQAFAGDDVIMEEFESEKQDVIDKEDDQTVDLTLPGWGDWAGTANMKKNKPKRKIVKTIAGVVKKDERADRGKKNVIINERVNKKNTKYQANGVPYPFETMEQYERSLRIPIGQEWSSRETHQKLTMPKVIVKHGSVVDPLKAPFK